MLYLIFDAADHGRAVLLAAASTRSSSSARCRSSATSSTSIARPRRRSRTSRRSSRRRVDPKPANPVAGRRPAHARVRGRALHAPDRPHAGAGRTSLPRRARRDGRVRRAVGRGQDDARQAARRSVPARKRAHPLQRRRQRRASTSTASASASARDAGHAALLRLDPREPAVRAARRDRRRVPRRASTAPPATACSRRADQGLDT